MKSTTESIQELFSFLKINQTLKECYLKSIEIDANCSLVPVSDMHLLCDATIKVLTETRNEHVLVYPTQFQATNVSTRKWLEDGLLANPNRILFLVSDSVTGEIKGYLGLVYHPENECLEIDNVIKVCSKKGVMGVALQKLLEWAKKNLFVEDFVLRVFEENSHAIKFYEKNGFTKLQKIPLGKVTGPDLIRYVEINNEEEADKFFLKMSLNNPERVAIPKKMLLTAGPSISQIETFYGFDAIANGWNANWSGYLTKFEKQFAEYVGAKHAIATSSCTGGLQISLMALNIGPGDEVIVPDLTWVATAKAIQYVGAKPVFCDVELDSWNICAKSAESLITENTKAIMPVHMYGGPARMDNICALAKKFNLYIIEDAAPAIGASFDNKKCGTFGDFGCFSFQGAKLMVTGEGGMIVTDNTSLYERAKKIADQGRNPNKQFWIDDMGVKFKMSNMQAAVGLGQLDRVDLLISKKRKIFDWYSEILGSLDCATLNFEVDRSKSIYWMSSLRLNEKAKISRDELMVALKSQMIDTRPVFPAISQYPIWGEATQPQPNAEIIGRNALNLPSGVHLERADIMYIAKTVRELIGG